MKREAVVAFEHRSLALTPEASANSLTHAELEIVRQAARSRPGLCELTADGLRFKQYCGILGLEHRSLEILPKIGFDDADDPRSQEYLLRWLRDSGTLPTATDAAAFQALAGSSLLDAFVSAFLESVSSLLKQGLIHRYESKHDDLDVLRGRIDLARQFGRLHGRPDRIACQYDELTSDVEVNRIIKVALQIVARRGNPSHTTRSFALLSSFSSVSDVTAAQMSLAPRRLDRQMNRYRSPLAWATMIIQTLSPSIRNGENEAPALLFDMNKVFESLAYNRLTLKARAHRSIRLFRQDTSKHLATYRGAPAIRLRPDIVIYDKDQPVGVADTKWKRLTTDRAGVPLPKEADIYQMIAYATSFGVSEATLIYPAHSGLRADDLHAFEVRGPSGTWIRLSIMLVDLKSKDYDLATSARWLPPV